MFETLEIFNMAHAMAKHAGARQTIIAQNMANVDTPNYVARDITPFSAMYVGGEEHVQQKATRNTHLHGNMTDLPHVMIERQNTQSDPNGNTVSLETEMMHAVDTKRQHDRAMMIYKSALTIMRSAVRR